MRLKNAIQECKDQGSDCVGVYGKNCSSMLDTQEYKLCKSGTVSSCAAGDYCKLGQKILTQGRNY